MLKTSASLVLGILFVVIGAVNVWLILQASARVKNAKASARLIAAHRIGGYIFIVLFCVMGWFMLARMRDSSGSASAGTMIHMTVAMLLSPLLFIKVLIARYYKNYYSFLLPIGLLIFVLSFVLVAITAGPYLLHNASIRTVSLEEINLPNASIDVTRAAVTMRERCSTCHNLDRVVSARKDARGWLATVNRMRKMPASGISEEDVKTVVLFLVSQNPDLSDPESRFVVARALVTQRCSACHGLDRVYKAAKTPVQWRETVAEMVSNAQSDEHAGTFQPGEDEQIIDFLSATQTPDAVNRRKMQANAASSAGQSLILPKASPTAQPAVRSRRPTYTEAGFTFVGCLGLAMLIVRRPGKIPVTTPEPTSAAKTATRAAEVVAPASVSANGAMVLQLVRVIQQTPDAKTLRFAVMDNRHFQARPGQFLTFNFLFDGKKVVRCYSICSSAATSGYVEITPKRVDNGCASVFLNDRAAVGMTVEANGPFGQFCFDESRHKRIVLIAGGSGITPMMAMLRYIDDLCLPTHVTLLYAVRTERDIIFEIELAELKARLKNFGYYVVLSQPPVGWAGPHGRINGRIVKDLVKEPGSSDFFLCGPGPFMDAARKIIIGLGVEPGRITQESFGGPPVGQHTSAAVETISQVEFARSGKVCSIKQGQTLLQVAEENGVTIPSGCRQGQCGTCKTKLLAGNVVMDAEQGLSPEAKAQGFVLTCVGRADGAVKMDA
jgi:ferredoxin-NADP reductase